MSLPRKSSRAITVSGRAYRWTFTQNDGWNDVIIQLEGGNGQKLCLRRDWMDQGVPPEAATTPADVAAGIRFALENGWEFGSPGPLLVLTVTDTGHTLR